MEPNRQVWSFRDLLGHLRARLVGPLGFCKPCNATSSKALSSQWMLQKISGHIAWWFQPQKTSEDHHPMIAISMAWKWNILSNILCETWKWNIVPLYHHPISYILTCFLPADHQKTISETSAAPPARPSSAAPQWPLRRALRPRAT